MDMTSLGFEMPAPALHPGACVPWGAACLRRKRHGDEPSELARELTRARLCPRSGHLDRPSLLPWLRMAQDEDTRHGSAERRWREDLAAWAIPQHILDAAPESPWHFPVELFARRADAAQSRMTASTLRALEALPMDGSVLDVGCGAGAASLPLAAKASG